MTTTTVTATTDRPSGGSGPSGGTSGNDDDDSSEGGEDARFDLGVSPDGGETPPLELGCDKIDFLLVIDSSTSMEDE